MKRVALVNERRKQTVACLTFIYFTAGWGIAYQESLKTSEDLLAVNVSVIQTKVCNGTSAYNGSIPDGVLCAGYMTGGRGACRVMIIKMPSRSQQINSAWLCCVSQSDGGSGLICGDVVKGIVLWNRGYTCAEENDPAVFTDVSRYKDWIKKNSASSGNWIASMVSMTILLVSITEMSKKLFSWLKVVSYSTPIFSRFIYNASLVDRTQGYRILLFTQ